MMMESVLLDFFDADQLSRRVLELVVVLGCGISMFFLDIAFEDTLGDLGSGRAHIVGGPNDNHYS